MENEPTTHLGDGSIAEAKMVKLLIRRAADNPPCRKLKHGKLAAKTIFFIIFNRIAKNAILESRICHLI
jgi:hypothetical protein